MTCLGTIVSLSRTTARAARKEDRCSPKSNKGAATSSSRSSIQRKIFDKTKHREYNCENDFELNFHSNKINIIINY